jgi:acyl-CoA synthetase (AMP-forming)/AMP-acid ligase II
MAPDFDAFDLSAWRIGGFGGAPMPTSTIEEMAKKLPKLQLLNAYGSTETTSPTTLMPMGLTHAPRDSVGMPLPCAEVLVMNDEGQALPSGEVGEIWISGPMVVKGYWNDPAASAREFTSGWWHSGDLGSLDAEGYLRIFDRKKDMLNRGGYKIYSVEVENVLLQIPGVLEAAIIGRPCHVLGERVHAVVYTLQEDFSLLVLQSFCKDQLADYKVPETLDICRQALPRNTNGKIIKRELRDALKAS